MKWCVRQGFYFLARPRRFGKSLFVSTLEYLFRGEKALFRGLYKVYIIELKCNHSSQKAVKQIMDKKYYEKYTETGREIYLMGINFDTEKRSIDDWQWGKSG